MPPQTSFKTQAIIKSPPKSLHFVGADTQFSVLVSIIRYHPVSFPASKNARDIQGGGEQLCFLIVSVFTPDVDLIEQAGWFSR